MPRDPRPLPAFLGDSFATRAAQDAGVSERRLRHRDLDTPFRGVRMRSEAPEPVSDPDESPHAKEAKALSAEIIRLAVAFATIAPADWFFSHVTAAVLWRLPLPLRVLRSVVHPITRAGVTTPARGLDVAVYAPRRASKAAGVNGHQLRPRSAHVRTVDGLRVTSPATTWALLATVLTVDELIDLGDAIVHIPRKRGMSRGTERDALAGLKQLVIAADVGRRHGVAKLREALGQIRVGSASPGETRTRLACVRAGLPEPDLDVDVIASDGTPIGYTELAYIAHRVLIEYEGDHHRRDRDQWNRDIEKHAACVAAGWSLVRLTSAHVYPTADAAVTRIRDALTHAGWRG